MSVLLVTGCPGKPFKWQHNSISTTGFRASCGATWPYHNLRLYAPAGTIPRSLAMAGSWWSCVCRTTIPMVSSGFFRGSRLTPVLQIVARGQHASRHIYNLCSRKEMSAFPALQSAKQNAQQGNTKDFGHIFCGSELLLFKRHLQRTLPSWMVTGDLLQQACLTANRQLAWTFKMLPISMHKSAPAPTA